MVQTELRRMENMLFEQKQQRTLIQIEMNTLLNQPVETGSGDGRAAGIKRNSSQRRGARQTGRP